MSLRSQFLKHPRRMAVPLMLLVPVFLAVAVWKEFGDDFIQAYRDLTKALITGKAE